mgnify:CR=1 FL=1
MIVSHKWGEKWILIQYMDGTAAAAAGRAPTVSFQAWDGDRWTSTAKAEVFETREEADDYLASHRERMTTPE